MKLDVCFARPVAGFTSDPEIADPSVPGDLVGIRTGAGMGRMTIGTDFVPASQFILLFHVGRA